MPRLFMPEASEQDRLLILRQNADAVEEATYQKPLSEEDKVDKMTTLSQNCINLSDLEEQKKEAMQVFKEQIDPLKKDNAKLILEIRTGQVTTKGKVYHYANHEEGMLETYDDEGILIESRRLKPHEKQGNLLRAIQ